MDWGIEDMNFEIVSFALHTATEVNARGLLNETQFKYDSETAIEKAFTMAPDKLYKSIFPLDVPRNNVLLRTIRAKN